MADSAEEPLVDPDEYARLVRSATDTDLQEGLDQNGELIVEQIFLAMPDRLRAEAVQGMSLAAEWRVRDAGLPGEQRWLVVIAEGRCTVERDGAHEPDVTFSVRGLDFVKLVTGNANGPRMFLLGRLKIRGDLLRAARFQACFRTPRG